MISKNKLGKNGPLVSRIGLGTRPNPGEKYTAETENQTIKTIHEALDNGINFLNTADFYGMGSNEMVIGKAIKDRRDKAFLSVKTGMMTSPTGKFLGLDLRPQAIKNFCSYSLTRLGVDEIDLYAPARIVGDVPIEETVGAIKDLIGEGKVKYLGMSEITAENLRKASAVHQVSALEIEYSLATRFIEKEILPTARELGVAVVSYSVFYYGLLTGNMNPNFRDGDYRKSLPRFQPENLSFNLEKVEKLKELAAAKGFSASQIALAWLLQQGDDIFPVVGMSKPERVADNLKSLEVVFTNDEKKLLGEIFAVDALKGGRYPAHLSGFIPE